PLLPTSNMASAATVANANTATTQTNASINSLPTVPPTPEVLKSHLRPNEEEPAVGSLENELDLERSNLMDAKFCFASIDKDGDGYVSKEDILDCLKELDELDPSVIHHLFESADRKRTGLLDFQAF